MTTKCYPNREFENKLRELKMICNAMWQMKGPKDTSIVWITCYNVYPIVVIHFTYVNGWDIAICSDNVETKRTIDDVITHVTEGLQRIGK